jgi:Flp pilus assembly protein TadD
MKRICLMFLLLLPGACASPDSSLLSDGPAGDNVARAALAAGSPDIALTVSNATLARTPRDADALLSQGDALTLLGRLDEAEVSYTRVLETKPSSVEARIGLGRLSLRSNPARAQTLFLSVLQREPANKIALNDLGITYDLQGDHLKAQDAYRKALGSDPTLHAAAVNLALSMALNGRASDAVRMLKPMASSPDAPRRVRHDLAVALAMAGDTQAAAQILSADMDPDEVKRTLLAYGAFRQ